MQAHIITHDASQNSTSARNKNRTQDIFDIFRPSTSHRGILQQIPCQGKSMKEPQTTLISLKKNQPLSRKHAILYYNPELSSSTCWPPSALQPLYTNSCSSVPSVSSQTRLSCPSPYQPGRHSRQKKTQSHQEEPEGGGT